MHETHFFTLNGLLSQAFLPLSMLSLPTFCVVLYFLSTYLWDISHRTVPGTGFAHKTEAVPALLPWSVSDGHPLAGTLHSKQTQLIVTFGL